MKLKDLSYISQLYIELEVLEKELKNVKECLEESKRLQMDEFIQKESAVVEYLEESVRFLKKRIKFYESED